MVCHRHFTSDRAALEHHGPRGCRDPLEMLTRDGRPRFVLRESGFGPIWGFPPPENPSWRATSAPASPI